WLTTPLLLTMAVKKRPLQVAFPFHRLLCVRLLSFIFCRSFF
ncbi:Ribonuclease T (EC 3.1.13.-), partial [Salmonella enterica subsp. enterica serovar Rissen]